MNPTPLTSIAERCQAILSGNAGDLAKPITTVTQDTRKLSPGDLYLALRGERFDGHNFVAAAAEAGAAAAIVAADAPADQLGVPASFPLLRVDDPLQALHRLAASWRAELPATVLCLTGSSGKTSTKEFLAAALSPGGAVSATKGNLNNHLGLPLSILATSREDRFAVWEIGMNHPGEIAPLAALARPELSLITNIGTAHIEFFQDRTGIAAEKGALFGGTHDQGLCFYPGADDFAENLAAWAGDRARPVWLDRGTPRAAHLQPTALGMAFDLVTDKGSFPVQLSVPGEHMVANALLAAAAALACDIPADAVAAALSSAQLVGGRLEQKLIAGRTVLDDTYNANPESVIAALRTLSAWPRSPDTRRVAVLGRMGELGHYAATGYERVGTTAAACADLLIAVGSETAPLQAAARSAGLATIFSVPSPAEAAPLLQEYSRPGDVILVKGSRAAAMETLLPHLADLADSTPRPKTPV